MDRPANAALAFSKHDVVFNIDRVLNKRKSAVELAMYFKKLQSVAPPSPNRCNAKSRAFFPRGLLEHWKMCC